LGTGINIAQLVTGKKKNSPDKWKAKALSDLLNRDIRLFSSSLSDKKKERFYSELNILLSAGVDLQSALSLICEEQSKERDKQLFHDVGVQIINGDSLSEAIRKTSRFTSYEYYTLQIGEETGKLSEVLEQLSIYFLRKIMLKRQIVNALAYPVLVLSVSFGAVFFMMRVVVPMFSDLFKRFKSELPSVTKLVIRISNACSDYSLPFSLLLAGLIVFMFSQRKQGWYRYLTSSIVLRIPFFGELIRKIYLARFCSSMSLLISSKTSLTNALELLSKMIGFYPIEVTIQEIKNDIIQKGLPLHVSMARFPVYGKRITSLVKVGEEVNKLDIMFSRIAKQYSDEVEHQSSTMGSLIEPFLIILLGLVVGTILVAMYLPLFQLSSSFQ
jgi:type IV pilus assembly protein PilC